MEYRFGISMRVTNASNYVEERDTISRDWSTYMTSSFPKSKFLFIPNIGEKAIEYIKRWKINILILSGGDDLGITPERDLTEIELLKYSIKMNIPIVAICRGMQLVHSFFGGNIKRGDARFIRNHRATNHSVRLDNKVVQVNSYHTNQIEEKSVNKSFNIIARCVDDDSIEGIESKGILAIMWHPERENEKSELNKILMENFFKKNGM